MRVGFMISIEQSDFFLGDTLHHIVRLLVDNLRLSTVCVNDLVSLASLDSWSCYFAYLILDIKL